MDKKNILQKFGEEERADVLNLYDKYMLSLDKDITLFGSGFYTPNIWKFFENSLSTKDFKINSYGFFIEAERRMISFNNIYEINYPIKIIKVEKISKFNELSHRDYLGSILGLGINRNKIGDLILQEDSCLIPVCEDIHEFILNNLSSVGKSPCKVTLLDDNIQPPNIEFIEEVIAVQSLRIDSIISKLSKQSRAKAQGLIESGMVLVDYNKIKDKSKEVAEGDRITIRGIGKFVLGKIIGNTKSGKCKVMIKKYT